MFLQALSEMKDQLERSLREKQLLSDERDNLTSCVSRLQGQLSDMQGQVNRQAFDMLHVGIVLSAQMNYLSLMKISA
jgi:vacuolar-type H+-ATPase subunit D/Vma8